jgi:acetyl-CoA carboxylase carboxyl transferase subunit alpha
MAQQEAQSPAPPAQAASAWDQVALARHEKRPYTLDYVDRISDRFIELHGDRRYGDDGAIVTGLALIEGRSVAVIGHQKGRTPAERRDRNFAMARPEGYRKALRIMELAAKMGNPIVSLIDTPGAACLDDAESRGISEAIARNQQMMFTLGVPVVAVVIGEGGSGGAIGIGVADRVMMMEHTYYSVIAPEACAAILWRDPKLKERAADSLKLTPEDALRLGIIDSIIPEPPEGAHSDPDGAAVLLVKALCQALDELAPFPPDELRARRYAKFRQMGMP